MKMTMRGIAKKAGVSIATVSRVFSPETENLVKPATKHKIMKIVKNEDYYPNSQARHLAGVPVKAIGIVLPQSSFFINNFYITEAIRGITKECDQVGFNVMLFATHKPLNRFNYQEVIKNNTVGGLILMNTGEYENSTVLELVDQKIPFVIMNNYIPHVRLNYVDLDNVDAAYQAVKYLISKGHRKIACLRGPVYSRNAKDRVKGYLKALKEKNIKLDSKYLLFGDFTDIMGKKAMEELLALKKRPTAVFACNDEMAFGAMQATREHGLKIPDDIAIIGFDNSRFAGMITPTLTSVAQPICDMGVEAVKILIARMKKPELRPVKGILKGHLVIRQSSE